MARASPLVRQWALLRTLCGRHQGVTVREMAEETGVNEKTIRRDLEAFEQAGFPLEETVCARGLKKWRIDPKKNHPGLSFAFDEAIALYLARRLLEPLALRPSPTRRWNRPGGTPSIHWTVVFFPRLGVSSSSGFS